MTVNSTDLSGFSVDLLSQPLFYMLGILYSTSDWSPLRDPFIESLNIMEECTALYLSYEAVSSNGYAVTCLGSEPGSV